MTELKRVPYPWQKRLTDKIVPIVILLILSPALLVVVFGMALDMLLCSADRGAWFYRERRISRGKEFDVLKFRVLREDVLAQMRQEGKHARIYEKDLTNLTWAGRHLIKRWYFDELPQLFNILRGDMSLVGPRPWPLSMVQDQIARGVRYRELIRAGWTGPAQLRKGHPDSRSSETLDLAYVERCRTWNGWRLWRYDMGVLWRTLQIMLEGKGLQY